MCEPDTETTVDAAEHDGEAAEPAVDVGYWCAAAAFDEKDVVDVAKGRHEEEEADDYDADDWVAFV